MVSASQQWVRMGVELQFMRGTFLACCIASACTFLAVLLFVQVRSASG